ncbi:alkaline ceramidase 3-like protein [Dinothrombium tinctorium]|uniref:Alkaline ceramidase n=1 Tax=Dinothrombium tinctorium TaxID=1965070 RepID=A0A3S3S1Y5_9ACAR|nr:alkaline ceramidase 3-like protein [Dinothrombium tinctorium]RWS09256.1 alkaline ceramidase 3-like protein [Dinothrombium tinctorium]RWS09289.1 alkaline ceramidase 3-like protein [Dinothrombium tinctorium]
MAPIVENNIGYWGNVTSTLDWCEKNYETTFYIAEFWNTVSNVFMIIPPIYSFISSLATGYEVRTLICYTLLTAVGIGSWLFHMTLKYEMQLFDELPMLWGSLFLVFVLATIAFPYLEDNLTFKMGLFVYGIIATTIYLTLKHPLLFQFSYGLLVAFILYLNIYVSRFKRCNAKLFYLSSLLYYTGFLIWNIDNIFCDYLHRLREMIPQVLVPFTQAHAIWHCFAGYGSYIHIYFCAQARALELKRKVRLSWDLIGLKLHYGDLNHMK